MVSHLFAFSVDFVLSRVLRSKTENATTAKRSLVSSFQEPGQQRRFGSSPLALKENF
jgi:hypothetical protein